MPQHQIENEISSLLQTIRRRHEIYLAQVAAAEVERPCVSHPATMARLDIEQSSRIGQLVYTCPACIHEATEAAIFQIQSRNGIPYDVCHASFANFDPTGIPSVANTSRPEEFLSAAETFQAGKIRNLILAGTPGIGKGHLAAAVCNAAIRRGEIKPVGRSTFSWLLLHSFFTQIHAGYSGANARPDALIEFYARRSLLVLDEVGMTPMPRDGARWLYDIVNMRHLTNRRTIILTGLAGPDLKSFLGPAIVDRLRAGGLKYLWGSWPSGRATKLDKSANINDF